MRDQADFAKNVIAFLSHLDEDDAGPDPHQAAKQLGIPRQDLIVLSRNENPYGPSPLVGAALQDGQFHRYPDSRPFLEALAGYTGFSPEWLVAGAGMDEIISTICRIFLGRGDRALIPVPTYNYYALAAGLCGARPFYQPRTASFAVNPDIPDGVKMVFLCSPNNPTSNALSEDNVQAVLDETDAIVFLDEAYVEFSERSLIHLVQEYDHLIVGRTLSKAFGLAGMRLGYAVAPAWIAEQYRRAAPPFYGISCASAAAGAAALSDLPFMRRSVQNIVSERERLGREIGCDASQANFLYLRTALPSDQFVEQFLCRGIIIRDCRSFRGSGEHQVRVTVGRPEENQRFLSAYREICR